MNTKKPRVRFHAKKWTLKVEKKRHEVTIKEESFKDLDKRIHYPISSSAYRGFSYIGGKTKKCMYA